MSWQLNVQTDRARADRDQPTSRHDAAGRRSVGSRPRVALATVIFVLASALTGCGSSETSLPTGPASPAAGDSLPAELEQLLTQVMSAPIDVSAPGPGLDRADRGMMDLLRQTGGVAEQLGPNGAAILAEIDAAETQAIAALVAKARPQSVTPGPTGAASDAGTAADAYAARQQAGPQVARFASLATGAMPGSGGQPHTDIGFEAFGTIAGLTLTAPDLFANAPRDDSGNAVLPTQTQDITTEHGATLRLTMSPTLTGSKLTADIKVVIKIAGPPAYEEDAAGRLSVELCPNQSGDVALELSLGGGFSLFGGGMQYNVALSATGHAADTGRLAGFDVTSDGSLAAQPMTGGAALGTAPKYIEMRVGYSAAPDGGRPGDVTVHSTRWSSNVDQEFARAVFGFTRDLGHLAALFGMLSAEHLWTNGYCVAITVPEMTDTTYVDGVNGGRFEVPYKRVDSGSDTPFTAVASHKFERQQLHVPVTATLASGTVSVTPSGTGVPAPAPFRYKAPDDAHQTAMVALATSSRRGIATLNIEFFSVKPAWNVDWTYGTYHLEGSICGGLDMPFSLHAVWMPGGAHATGEFTYAPKNTAGGTWSYTGTVLINGITATLKGSGPYRILDPDSKAPVLSMDNGTWTMTVGGVTGAGSAGWNPTPIPLVPGSGC